MQQRREDVPGYRKLMKSMSGLRVRSKPDRNYSCGHRLVDFENAYLTDEVGLIVL
jgi:hypothetical protein